MIEAHEYWTRKLDPGQTAVVMSPSCIVTLYPPSHICIRKYRNIYSFVMDKEISAKMRES